jgi:hypothetical protein
MNKLARAIRHAISHFKSQKLPFALIGGLAVSARTEPRFTRDADFAVVVSDDKEAEGAIHQLISRGYQVVATVEHDVVDRLATVRLSLSDESASGVVTDLLFASSGIEKEIVEEADSLEIFDDLSLPVCTLGHLLALKILSQNEDSRPQDLMDIKALLQVADNAELTRARRAVALITERGFHRGRDLTEDLESAIQKYRRV